MDVACSSPRERRLTHASVHCFTQFAAAQHQAAMKSRGVDSARGRLLQWPGRGRVVDVEPALAQSGWV